MVCCSGGLWRRRPSRSWSPDSAKGDSNEVYKLKISKEILEDCGKAEGGCRFQELASAVADMYREKYKDPITVVGVRSEAEESYINPKNKEFSEN
jgi:hypothetical protein